MAEDEKTFPSSLIRKSKMRCLRRSSQVCPCTFWNSLPARIRLRRTRCEEPSEGGASRESASTRKVRRLATMRFCNSLVGFSRQSASKALSHCVEISKVVCEVRTRRTGGISFSRYGTSSARESFWTAEASRSSSAAYLDGVSVDSVGTLASRGVVAAGVSATQAIDDKNSTTRTLRHSTIVRLDWRWRWSFARWAVERRHHVLKIKSLSPHPLVVINQRGADRH